jgi:hypothetical protein
MATPTAKGIHRYENTNPMEGPAQMSQIADDVDALVDATKPAPADLPSSGNWPGRSFYVESDKSTRKWDGSGWVGVVGTYRSAATPGIITAALTSVASVTVPAGTWKIDGYAYFDWSTATARKYTAEIYNSTASASVLSGGAGPIGTVGAIPVGLGEVVTVTATTTFQLRVSSSAVDGTQLLANGRLLVTQTTLRS